MAVDVLVGEGGEGLIVHDDDVRGGAGLQHAQLHREVLFADLGVVAEQHVRDLAPAHVGQTVLAALGAQGHLQGLQHIVGIGIGAHAQQDAPLVQLEHRADADGVAHVALGVVDHHGAGLLDDLHLGGVHMDAVAQNGLFAQDAVVLQALDGTAAIILQGVVHVVHALGHMDVVAGAAVVGGYHAVEGLVADGEQGVSAEHGSQHGILVLLALGDEVGIFLDGLQALLLAVPVGDLIAQAGADAEFLGGLGDGVQGAGDLGV